MGPLSRAGRGRRLDRGEPQPGRLRRGPRLARAGPRAARHPPALGAADRDAAEDPARRGRRPGAAGRLHHGPQQPLRAAGAYRRPAPLLRDRPRHLRQLAHALHRADGDGRDQQPAGRAQGRGAARGRADPDDVHRAAAGRARGDRGDGARAGRARPAGGDRALGRRRARRAARPAAGRGAAAAARAPPGARGDAGRGRPAARDGAGRRRPAARAARARDLGAQRGREDGRAQDDRPDRADGAHRTAGPGRRGRDAALLDGSTPTSATSSRSPRACRPSPAT